MLPIGNKPIIHYVIEEAIESGIDDIAIITSKGKTVIEEYIDSMNFKARVGQASTQRGSFQPLSRR